jgi:hypothetical protein
MIVVDTNNIIGKTWLSPPNSNPRQLRLHYSKRYPLATLNPNSPIGVFAVEIHEIRIQSRFLSQPVSEN